MIRKKQENYGPYVIDLTGPQGNAFVLLGYAKQFARQLKFDSELKDKIIDEMTQSDYEHLVETFDKYFGEFVIKKEEWTINLKQSKKELIGYKITTMTQIMG
jgi:hypothetical protein